MEEEHINKEILLELVYASDIKDDEQSILRKVLMAYLRKLNCFLAGIFALQGQNLENKYILPHMFLTNPLWDTLKFYIATHKREFVDKAFLKYTVNDDIFYIFKINDYGFLILGRKKPLSDMFINDLTHVISYSGKVLTQSVIEKEKEEFEKAITRERQLLRTIIDNIPVRIYVKDNKLRKTLVNNEELGFLGVESEDEVLGKTDYELFDSEMAEKFFIEDEKVLNGDTSILNEENYLGNNRWGIISKVPLKDVDGNINGIVGLGIDFTEQKRNREQLQIFSDLFDNLSDSVQIAFENGQMFYINQEAAERFGVNKDDVRNYKAWEFEPNIENVASWNSYVEQLRLNKFFRTEGMQINRKTGKSLPVEMTVKYSVINGQTYITGIARDITERKRYEEELKNSNNRYEQLAIQSGTIAWELDVNGMYTYITPVVEKVLGYSPGELVGIKYFYDMLTSESRSNTRKLLHKMMKQQQPIVNMEMQVYHKNGHTIWLLTNGSPMYSPNGEYIGFRGSDTDITERKLQEKIILQNEGYQRALLENLSLGIMIVDPVTRIVETVNSFAAKMFNALPEDIIGKQCHNFICPAKYGECPVCERFNIIDNSDRVMYDINGGAVPVLKTIKTIHINGKVKLLESFIEIRERKEIERQLKESEERKAALIASMNDVVFVLDDQLNFIEYHYHRNFDFSVNSIDSILYKKFQDVITNKEVTDEVIPVFYHCLESGETSKIEFCVNHKKGQRWYEITVTRMTLNSENALTCVVRDISENKQHELIINNQIKLQELLIKISTTYINIDVKSTEDVINQSLMELGEYVGADRSYIFDYDLDNNTCTNTYEWVRTGIFSEIKNLQEVPLDTLAYLVEQHENGLPFIIKDIDDLAKDGPNGLRAHLEPQNIKSLITIPLIDERELIGFVGFDYVSHIHPYSEIEKQLLQIYAEMLVNLENRKRGQNFLISQEEKYRNIISNMQLGFVLMDNFNNVLDVNKQFCNMSGYTQEELKGKNAAEFVIPGKKKDLLNYKRSYLKSINIPAIEMVFRKKNGEKVWWLINGAPQYNDKKELIGTISVFLDITSQKKIQSDLELSKNLAEDAAKAKELFLTNMSHEIRTPLNVIIGMIRELSKENLTKNQRTYLEHSEAASYHLLSIVNNVMDMSKIEVGEFVLENIDFNIYTLVANVKSILSSRAQSKKINMTFEVDPQICQALVGDPVRLSQVLINFLGNSLKFTDEGFIRLHISSVAKTDTYQKIEFSVQDSGIGMSLDFQQKIFNKFTQENSRSNRIYEGTGLGLSISKEIIELMGGTITFRSEKGKGTEITFDVSFPIGNQNKLVNLDKTTKSYDISGSHILIVEDNDMNRFIARQSLKQAQCIVAEASNGIEAVEKIKSGRFDIILMDIQMPVMDGVEATMKIRNELKKQTPIIALTANAFKHDVDQYLNSGMNDFLIKPYKEEDLYMKIENNLRQMNRPVINSEIDNINSEKENMKSKNVNLYSTKQIETLGGGDKSFVNSMLELFVKLANETVEQIEQSIKINNIEIIKRVSHKIKPSLDNLEISSLYEDIRYLEALDKDGQINDDVKLKANNVIVTLKSVVDQINKDSI
ncbi:MAG: PAS domain S-box protein [Paludibacter sp.]|nr:PAS domain S-box protein [Paludibacter sp.]